MTWPRILILLPVVYGSPASYFLKGIAESNIFDEISNSLPKYDDMPSSDYQSSYSKEDLVALDVSKREGEVKSQTNDVMGIEQLSELSSTVTTPHLTEQPELSMTSKSPNDTNTTETNRIIEFVMTLNNSTNTINGMGRFPRQEQNDTEDDPEFASREKESQEDGSDEGNGNMITGLLSAFLGGLSRPDGGIDLDAIVGLLGSLSTQNPDGTYDFQGLTDLLQGFFGGGDGAGGSDIEAFVGGLLGAVIKGVANPPGPKGAGILTGKIVSGILPALSAPADTGIMDNKKPPQEGVLDSGSFLGGLLKTVLGASSGSGGGRIDLVQSIVTSVKSLIISSSKSH
ncbi:uncharacterized protein isoform X1 [Leptinotarsa decemlineata]|uniref:uncharacterized protein isoform X1 n=2 Tax=Leptinotarsa decemlineata TaxID=7539 RepID=UPI003D30C41F